jgi:hypothetical protein
LRRLLRRRHGAGGRRRRQGRCGGGRCRQGVAEAQALVGQFGAQRCSDGLDFGVRRRCLLRLPPRGLVQGIMLRLKAAVGHNTLALPARTHAEAHEPLHEAGALVQVHLEPGLGPIRANPF